MQKIIITTAFLLSSAAFAIPETFLYVGDLDEDGAPADGNFSVTFQMFDDEAAGSKVFEETVASLVVVDGALVHELGASASDPLDDAELGGDLYLSVVVNGTVLEPRVPIRAVPFARLASKADDADLVGGLSPENITAPGAGLTKSGLALAIADDGVTRSMISDSDLQAIVSRPLGCGGGIAFNPGLNQACDTLICLDSGTVKHMNCDGSCTVTNGAASCTFGITAGGIKGQVLDF